MFRGYHGIAHAEPLQSRLIDERSRKMTCGALERASGRRHLQGLLALATLREIIHFRMDILRFPRNQPENDLADDLPIGLENAVTVSQVQRIRLQLRICAIRSDGVYLGNDLLHLTVIRPCVHEHRTADAARNAHGKLHAGQSVIRRKMRYVL